ncbi:MAG: extracellular solute-binding protein [Clostridia bacterium]|nr:extracellular solute-binding protein [Clostridia bacterium]
MGMKRACMLALLLALCALLCAAGETLSERVTYADCLLMYADAPAPDLRADALPLGDTQELDGERALIAREGETVSFLLPVESAGLYQIGVRCYPLEDKGLNIEFSLAVDGKLPFAEAEYNTLSRIWADNAAPGSLRDAAGNDIIPGQHEEPEWYDTYIEDHTGTYSGAYRFYLTRGEHTVTLKARREILAVCALWAENPPEPPAYADVLAAYARAGYTAAKAGTVMIEAEQAARRSDAVLYARTDRSSPLTTPYSTMETRLNTIGGGSWNTQGQWIEWEFDAPADGLYRIALRARQDLISGSFTTRRLYIDGALPFREAGDLRVNYDTGWQNIELPYDVYLSAGRHTLRMEATIGALSDIVSQIDAGVYELNEAYRRIVMLTGTSPDTYRDYKLDVNIPEVFGVFEKNASRLRQCDEMLLSLTGKRGSMNGILQTLAKQLEEFCEKPETVPKRLSSYKSNVGSLGSWLIQIKQLPLEIDKIYVMGGEAGELQNAEAGFFRQVGHELSLFYSSFAVDYSVIGTLENDKKARVTEVWVSAGRDQANIIKQLIDNYFTPATGISVNLKLVQGQLMNATAAGAGPDVALQLGNAEPVNYAVRGAAYDLTQFPDYDEVASRFRASALTPYRLEGGVYALPETQTFSVMFCRTDVLDELGLEAPETWEELFHVVGRLQRKNMTVGIQPPNSAAGSYNALSTMAMLLYQRGGEMYLDGSKRSGLSSLEAREAFSMWVSLYIDYELPVKYDALTRFRSGEMPVLIEDFTFYNLLQVAAPEIRGMWSFTRVPGTTREDGSVDHSVSGTGICCMLMSAAKDKDAAWEFMKWWTSAEVQTRYGRDIENQLGVSARYPSANVDAFANMPWSASELALLNAQWPTVRGIPEVPGGYFTARHLNNAFRRVINYKEDPGETLMDYVKNIDAEISIKRREFGLEVYDDAR